MNIRHILLDLVAAASWLGAFAGFALLLVGLGA